MGGSRIGQSVLNCWAFAIAVAAIMPIVAANLDPPQDGTQRFITTGTRVQQAVLNAWLPPQPAPILARNLNPPISGPTPNNPPIVGMRIPAAATVAWIPPSPAPILGPILTPSSGPQRAPLIGMRIPAAVQVAWIPPQPAPIVSKNLNPPIGAPGNRTQTRSNEPIYLLEVQAYNPNTAMVELKRFSTVSITTKPDDPIANTVYDGRMINAGELKRSMFENGGTIGKPTTNIGYFELNNADGALDYLLDYGIGGWQFTLKLLADKDDYVSTAMTVFIGTMRGFASSDLKKTIQVRIRDKLETLNQPLLTTRYAGTTNSSAATAEGDSSMAGKLKPYSIGFNIQCPVQPANSYDLIYQGAVNAQQLILAFDGGVLLSQDADYASIALLRAATIPAGHFATCYALGLFRLGALPAKTVTAWMESSTTEANISAGAIAKQILLDGGVSIGDIDTASFAALTSGSGNWETGIFINDSTTVIDAACSALNNVAATLVSTATGKFKAVSIGTFPDSVFFNPIFQDETPVDTYTNSDLSDNSQFVLQASPQAEGDGAPVYDVNVKYKRKWQTLSVGDLVSGLSARFVSDAASEFYELAQGNLGIRTAQPLAQLINVETTLSSSSGAIILGLRLFDFYGKRRDYLTFDLPAPRAGTVDLGDIVIVKPTDGSGNPRYGYGADGKRMCIIGRHDRFGEGKVTLTAWG